jgi:oligopeptidase B
MKREFLILLIMINSLAAGFCKSVVPVYPEIKDSIYIHQQWHYDNYSWLEDINNPMVKKVLKQEQKHTQEAMKSSVKLANIIYKEFLSRLNETESTQPYYYKGYYYYSRTEKGKSFSINCRKRGSLEAREEIVLDENKLAKGKKFFSLGAYSISPDQQRLAYSIDYKGDEIYKLYIKDLKTGRTKATQFDNVSDVLWMGDSQTLLITTMNARLQTDTLLRWKADSNSQEVLYQEKDPAWDISIYHSTLEKMIFVTSDSKDASEIYYLSNEDYQGSISVLYPRQNKHQIYADFYDDKFYAWTKEDNGSFSIITQLLTKKDKWETLYQSNEQNPISGFLIFDKQLVVLQREQGFKALYLIDRLNGDFINKITPAEPSDMGFWVNVNPLAEEIFYTIENEVTPLSIVSYNLATQKQKIIRQYSPAGDYDKNQYQTSIAWVNADDGTQIPLRLTYKSNLDLSIPHVVKLTGYGAYGDCEDPYFSSTAFSLLDRDIILATAYIRGGGEFGNTWYNSGKLLNKKNSFTDFIACMDFLIESGITTKEMLVIEGGSAGGLLMGAVVNQAYDKCAMVVADVPFVDLVNTMLDDSLPLTQQEYEEWGNPNIQEYFDYMLSYSPIDNVKPTPFPIMLISTAINDTRVGYWEAVKWTAKLRSNNKSDNSIILRISSDEGHTGQVDRYKSLKSYAETVGFTIWKMTK